MRQGRLGAERLPRLLQLTSPTLPIGAYSYSQGLEWAIEAGWVADEAGAARWIGDQLEWSFGRFELAYLAHMLAAWRRDDADALARSNASFLAGREGAELRAETLQMGHSLRRLAQEIDDVPAGLRQRLDAVAQPSLPLAWSGLAVAWGLGDADAVAGYAWGWIENQVLAALKSVPLGQSAGQRLLGSLGTRIAPIAAAALASDVDAACNFAPGAAIASARHETQYSRLFRS